ncbi:histone-lysine N-methyltransferase 2B-like [Ptychodera flava]|uniref:histone-lysine N-methyltransferase 2B-like n=1 Tax=Ptychodera flava TaxID=63121 RepID=UPI00396A1776
MRNAVTSSSNLGASAALRSIVQQNHLHGAFLAPVSLLPPLQNTNVSQQFTAQQSSTITSTATGVRRPARPDQITELSNILSAAGLDSLSNLSPAELASLHQALVTQSAIDLDLVSAKLFGTPKAKKRKHQQSNKRTKKPKTTQKPRQRNPSVWIDANGVMHGAVGREMVTIDTAAASEKSSPKTDVPGPSLAKPKPRIKNPGSTPSRPRMKHPTFQADESTSTFNPANSSWEKAVEERLKNADLSVYSLLREPPMLKDQKSGETSAEAEKGKKKRKRKEKLQAKNDDGATFDEGVSVTKPKKAKSKSRPKEPCVDLTNLPDESRDDDEEEDEDDAEAGSFLMKLMEQEEKRKMNEPPKIKDEPHLVFEVSSDDGFHTEADTISEAWLKVLEKVQETRNSQGMKYLSFAGVDGTRMIGITHDAVVYLTEQLYGAKNCRKYKFKFHQYETSQDFIDEEPPINPHGCARTECYTRRSKFDMFNFLASKHRKLAIHTDNLDEEEEIQHKSARRATSMDLPMAMRFRHLQRTSREAVGVYRSKIHGRGLFCKRPIDAGEMVIEYSGTVIRSVLTDKREKYYDSKGIGCYMFRIDDYDVVDATMHGNAARFINHSCEPNCFSRVIQVDGKKHIVIFASRKIMPGEELTYDYKFPFEEEKIPCTCGSKKCRKYLN